MTKTIVATVTAVVITVAGSAAYACHTPTRAAVLAKQYPHLNIVKMSHDAHAPNPIPYSLKQSSECENGMADIFPCSNVELVAHLDIGDIGGGTGSDSWGWKDPLTNRYYALVGRSSGTAFVDITDPSDPVYLGNLPSSSPIQQVWRDIKTYENHAFIVADEAPGHGLQVFDLNQLRQVTNPPVTFTATTVLRGAFSSAHNIVINEDSGFAYAVGSDRCAGGLLMIDIRTPSEPSSAGCFSGDGYTHDAQCVIYRGPDTEHQGKEICFASNEDTVTVVDVTNKASPVMLSRTTYDVGYTHQGWLTEDQQYFLLDDEFDELTFGTNTRTLVWDMSDLDNPRNVGEHIADGPAIDHNQYIVGDYVFQANYRRGLRVLKIVDPANAELEEVAYIDTYPEADGSAFDGAWNVYPFFDNGLVMISDFNRGLFIVRPELPDNPDGIGNEVLSNPYFNDAEGLYTLADADGETVSGTGIGLHLLQLPEDSPTGEDLFMFGALYDYVQSEFPSAQQELTNNETFRTFSAPMVPLRKTQDSYVIDRTDGNTVMLPIAQSLGEGSGSQITGLATITANNTQDYQLTLDFTQAAVEEYDQIVGTETEWQPDEQLNGVQIQRTMSNFFSPIIEARDDDGVAATVVQCQEHELLVELDEQNNPVGDTGISLHQLGGLVFAARFGYKFDANSGSPLDLSGNLINADGLTTTSWASDWLIFQGGDIGDPGPPEQIRLDFFEPAGGIGFNQGSNSENIVIATDRSETLTRQRNVTGDGMDEFIATDVNTGQTRRLRSLLPQSPGCQ